VLLVTGLHGILLIMYEKSGHPPLNQIFADLNFKKSDLNLKNLI